MKAKALPYGERHRQSPEGLWKSLVFPACLDREIEELNKTERLLASQFPEVFG